MTCVTKLNTTSSIIKLRVMPTEENSRTGFKMLPTALWWQWKTLVDSPFYHPVFITIYNSLKLKGQCIGSEAMQSCVISQPVKSLSDVVLRDFVEYK